MSTRICLAAVLCWVLSSGTRGEEVSFNRDIRPILSENCYHCHGFDENHREAGLRLDRDADAHHVFDIQSPSDSELIRRILSDDPDVVMLPPAANKARLSDEQISRLTQWIGQGANYEPHWAFVAPVRSAVGGGVREVIDHWVQKRLEREGLAIGPAQPPGRLLRRLSLDLTGLPATAAEIDAFVREHRVNPDQAIDAAVDRLLASPAFGQRMAIEWLDVARYADTNGFQMDANNMNWPWRDWVVDALNNNLPHDQFIVEQLAGDLLPDPTPTQQIATAFNRNHMLNGEGGAIPEEIRTKNVFDRLETTSTALLGLTVGCCQCHDHKFDPLKQSDYFSLFAFFNQISETGGVDMTFGGKPDQDGYSPRYGIAAPYLMIAGDEQRRRLTELSAALDHAKQTLQDQQAEYEPQFIGWVGAMRQDQSLIPIRVPDADLQRVVLNAPLDQPDHADTIALRNEFLRQSETWSPLIRAINRAKSELQAYQSEIPHVMVMRDDRPRETFVLLRGNYETPGQRVTAGVPEFLPPLPDDEPPNRLTLARWLVSQDHPLTSRVIVNRYWQLFFGRGIVQTTDDFGLQGAWPTHPELLDDLAVEFQRGGWDLKRLIKSIVTSRTYQQAMRLDDELLEIDPDNELLSRGPRRRLDSRILRDQALALSGLLSNTVGGRPVLSYQPPGIWEDMSLGRNRYQQASGEGLYRRSLYTFWRRIVAPANFFDVPSRQNCSVTSRRTNTPLQALTLLNDPTYVEAARVWAQRLMATEDRDVRLTRAFAAATGRQPVPEECDTLNRALDRALDRFTADPDAARELLATGDSHRDDSHDAIDHAAWTTICLLILNLDETITN